MIPHDARPVLVWVDADIDIAGMVERLNTMDGVRTFASCQGTTGEGGPHPYPAYVMATWPEETLVELLAEYDVTLLGNNWGHVHPRP